MVQFNKKILVVDRVSLVMNDETIAAWGIAAGADREGAATNTALILGKLQRDIACSLYTNHPEAALRGEILWTSYGSVSLQGLFVIASNADNELLNSIEDQDYLCHLRSIQEVATASGFNVNIQRVQTSFPINTIEVPASLLNS
ncbi:hypothetical protein HOS33_gp309 [Erwinia phage vB_EamM_Y3]|uniref:Uncharacterized protein n=1 Tax=Erwinia phage vB_EamM_Y3 TaxID=1983553 RepID=A0A2H4IBN2_9CAUD|nr:hypothetical protein HOS33_gp309 [Erwinia phage vB_EamM_Y3]ARW58949.1 hypothetical protein Y3_309 [Erwinia phage vB_EamM_Y3]QZE56171.1 hypothetical protein pEaSNUABM52_00313 [Erwinia phage pEp_SNUABM_52]